MSDPHVTQQERIHALDAVRASALLLGVVLHAAESFIPGMERWLIVDHSPSVVLSVVFYSIHQFRMPLFFFMAGFFAHLVYHREGPRAFFVDRRGRILFPFLIGWPILMMLFGAVFLWARYKINGGVLSAALATSPSGDGFPLGHLWFLYYLLLMYVVVLPVRRGSLRFDTRGWLPKSLDKVLRHAVEHHWAPLLLAMPLCAYLYGSRWVVWFGIATPDKGLLPQLPALIGFGTAFCFGWLLHRQPQLLQIWARAWPIYLVAAGVLTAVCLTLVGPTPSYAAPVADAAKLSYALCYTTGIWVWAFAFIGLAFHLFSTVSHKVRYVADASYWIYLTHLPVVMAMQVVVAYWSWHWIIKFPVVLGLSFSLLFLSYHHWVRYTFVGERLNGHKRRKRRA